MSEAAIAVVGVGLIGGSIAAAVKARMPAARVIGVGRRHQRLADAQAAGLLDEITTSVAEAARESSLLVVCTPVDSIARFAAEALDAGHPDLLVTDGGSVKQAICDPLPDQPGPGGCFVGSHPLAGSEKQGFEFSSASLFEDRLCVITPPEGLERQWVERLTSFWGGLGARVLEMSAAAHDVALSETSHLPHLVASALAVTLQSANQPFTATGFRDTTRIAAGDPELWSAILLANARAMLDSMDRLDQTLSRFREAIERGDADRLKLLLAEGKTNRQALDDC